MSQIVVSSNGYTYKHPQSAQVGDIWIGFYTKELILVTETHAQYISFIRLTLGTGHEDQHFTTFYSTFEKYEAS